jgi:transposase
MNAYSMDLRKRVAAAVDHHEGSLREIARRFRVSLSFVTRLLAKRRRTRSLAPRPHGGGHPPALNRAGLSRLRRLVRKQPDATLEELASRVGVRCSRMAIFRALLKLRITRKKKSLHAQERDTPRVRRKRKVFRKQLEGLDPASLVFVDETGANTAMTRTYGRAPRGKRVKGSVPGRWKSVTLISGLRLSGVVAPLAFEGATDAPTFEGYVKQSLAPQLRPGDVVIWDNLKPHKVAEARRVVEGAGATLIPMPPYSPDLSPIEEMWSKVKGALKSLAARTTEGIYDAMGIALRSVCREDILGWFKSCGLCANQA